MYVCIYVFAIVNVYVCKTYVFLLKFNITSHCKDPLFAFVFGKCLTCVNAIALCNCDCFI